MGHNRSSHQARPFCSKSTVALTHLLFVPHVHKCILYLSHTLTSALTWPHPAIGPLTTCSNTRTHVHIPIHTHISKLLLSVPHSPGILSFDLREGNGSGAILLRTRTLGVGLTASSTDTTFDKAPALALVTDNFEVGSVSADALHIRSTASVDGG